MFSVLLRQRSSKLHWIFQRRRPSLARVICTDASSSLSPDQTREPPPIRVSLTSSAGRGVFATRNIRIGEVIHTAKPVVAHPYPSVGDKVCYYCLRRLGTVCSGDNDYSVENGGGGGGGDGDGSVRFCSEKCKEDSKVFYEVERRANWAAFDDYCKEREFKYPFMVKRLACMVVCGTTSASSLNILQPSTLPPHAILQMEDEFQLLKSSFLKTQIEDKYLSFLTKEWYVEVLARIRINAFRIEIIGGSYENLLNLAAASVVSEAAVGNAVYMLPSFYNHDCDPNTHMVWIDDVDAKMKALRDIESDEELRISYIDASMVRDARQRILYQGFGFHCNCSRCTSDD